jgi:GntR family transcriptional regulator/MocR family aminotransferase
MVKRAGGSLLLSIRIDPSAPQSLSTQLCAALRDLILTGGFAAGERLPASRTLAHDLKLSRTTIVEAFSRLTDEGLIESRTGSGTYVSTVLSATRPKVARPHPRIAVVAPPRLSAVMAQAVERFAERKRLPHAPRAFTTALPAFDAFPMAQWARLSAKYLRGARNDVMGYGEPFGEPALRRAVASHLRANRGIACEPEQIFILSGAQQAFHLVGSLLLNPGDKVWFENPGAIGARNSLIACGADLVPVPVDDQGLCVEAGLQLAPRFRLAFVTPSHQQPLGSVMSLKRRFALLHAAEQANAWVIEDDYDGEFFFGGRPPPTLKSVDTNGVVIYVGTFSKSLFPALRLGYVLAPPALVDTFEIVMSKFLQGVPSHTQGVVAAFIDEGHFAAHTRRMRLTYQERHDALVHAAGRHLKGLLDVARTDSGLHTVGYLPHALRETEIARDAAARDLSASPIGRFAIAPVDLNGLVLGFGSVPPKTLEAGVKLLAEVIGARVKPRAAARR